MGFWTILNTLLITSTVVFVAQSSEETCYTKTSKCHNCYGNVTCNVGSDSHLRFFVLGDWGGMGILPFYTRNQDKVAERMVELAKEQHVDFVLTLGDNFYWSGIDDGTDVGRFKESFEDIYDHPVLRSLPWYAIAGNHDHIGNASAQCDYMRVSNRWIFPKLFYTASYQFEHDTKALFIFLDTIVLCGNTDLDDAVRNFVLGEEETHALNAEEQKLAEVQWKWLEETLEENHRDYDYIFVSGHYPVYSVGKHGPMKCLLDRLKPLLEHYEVSAYLNGHDHNLQHIQTTYGEDKTMNYLISGAGAYMDTSKSSLGRVPDGAMKYFFPSGFKAWMIGKLGFGEGGVAMVTLSHESADIHFYSGDSESSAMYSASIPKRTRS